MGDLLSVPFKIAYGCCRNRKQRNASICLNVNPVRAKKEANYVDGSGDVQNIMMSGSRNLQGRRSNRFIMLLAAH